MWSNRAAVVAGWVAVIGGALLVFAVIYALMCVVFALGGGR